MTDPVDELAAARTPAEAKRHWMIDRLWNQNVFAFALVLFLVFVIWLGAWPEALAELRLKLLGVIAAAGIGYQLIVAISFSLGGPVGRWRARWGDKEFSADDDDCARNESAYDGRPE